MRKLVLFMLLFTPALAQASDQWGINDFTHSNVALGTRSVKQTIGGVVNIVLGFLGILATLGILFGGFKMMTSGGNSDQNQAGRSAVTAGAIGLLVVLAAYIISRFVLQSLYDVTI